jgi:hypothetical protein
MNAQSSPGDKIGNRFLILILILITVVHFSIPLVATWDTAHYHNYLDILYGNKSWDNWDVIRGPVFPVLIAFAHLIFGYSHIGMLLWSYLVTLIILLISICFIKELISGISNVIRYFLLWIGVFLNPVFLGFYHTLLTEYVASFLTIFSVYVSYLWVNNNLSDHTRAKFILLSLIFITIIPVSFHLKQPYVNTTLMPLIGASLFSIYFNRKMKNIIQRLTVILTSIALLIASVIAWHHFLPDTGIASKKVRMSYYMVSDRLYRGLSSQVPENMKETQRDPLVHDMIVNGISLGELSLTEIEKDQSINYIDKKRALRMKATGADQSYGFVFIADADGAVIDKILVGGNPGIGRSSFELIRIFIAHPMLSLKKYTGNYFQMTRLTKNPWMETEAIAFKSYEAKGFGNNVFWVMPSYESLISPYKQFEINSIGYFPYRVFKGLALSLFPWLLNGFGAIWILFTFYILYLSTMKRITKKYHELKDNKMVVFLFISSFTIFSQIVFPYVLLGATNDRYAFPAYSLSLIVFVIMLLKFIAFIKERLMRNFLAYSLSVFSSLN